MGNIKNQAARMIRNYGSFVLMNSWMYLAGLFSPSVSRHCLPMLCYKGVPQGPFNCGQLKSRLHSSLIKDWLSRYLNRSLPSVPVLVLTWSLATLWQHRLGLSTGCHHNCTHGPDKGRNSGRRQIIKNKKLYSRYLKDPNNRLVLYRDSWASTNDAKQI